jgi:hypothetical protein
VTLAELYIAAFQYYDGPDIADLLEDGLMLRLNRDRATAGIRWPWKYMQAMPNWDTYRKAIAQLLPG